MSNRKPHREPKNAVEGINPHFFWDRRKKKRELSKRSRKLRVGNYAIGCSGNPGIVVFNNWYPGDIFNSYVKIKSLVDGNIESCSMYNCSPDPITKEFAEKYAVCIIEQGRKKALMCFFPLAYYEWEKLYYSEEFPKTVEHNKKKTLQEYMNLNDDEYAFYLESVKNIRELIKNEN